MNSKVASPDSNSTVPSPAAGQNNPSKISESTNSSWFAVLILMVFAFLLASFPARNSDLWMYLSQGRAIFKLDLAGFSQFNLFSIAVFVIHRVSGDTGLAIVKAIWLAVLALGLYRCCIRGKDFWFAFFATFLSLLAMSTRMLLQPDLFGYGLFLAIIFTLFQSEENREWKLPSWFPQWQILLLFWLWANVDSSFQLGLLILLFFWLGESMDYWSTGIGGKKLVIRRGIHFLITLSVCMLNANFLAAFDWLTLFFRTDWQANHAFLSPFSPFYLNSVGRTPAGLAFYPLLGLTVCSFLINRRHWFWHRILPWTIGAICCCIEIRLMGYFAILSAPLLSWNLHEFFSRRNEASLESDPIRRRILVLFQIGLFLFAILFVIAAWPGWLQGPPFERRRWELEPRESLVRAAKQVQKWQDELSMPAAVNMLHFSPDSLAVFSWFAPEQRGFLESWLADENSDEGIYSAKWQRHIHENGIEYFVVYHPEKAILFQHLAQFLADPAQWPLVYLQGNVAIFGWSKNSPQSPSALPSLPSDLYGFAFGRNTPKLAPSKSPDDKLQFPTWYDAFWQKAHPQGIDRDEASIHLLQSEIARRSAPLQHLETWKLCQVTAMIGAPWMVDLTAPVPTLYWRSILLTPDAPSSNIASNSLQTEMTYGLQRQFFATLNDTPPSLLFLAIRAARRAIATAPRDAQAYLALGESYLRLQRHTNERNWMKSMGVLDQLRKTQAAAALYKAVQLDNGLLQGHLALISIYQEYGYLDLVLEHQKKYYDLIRELPPPSQLTSLEYNAQLQQYEEQLKQLEEVVANRLQRYEKESANLRVLDRATIALEQGLAGKALNLLLASDVSAFGDRGMSMELDLLLNIGRAWEVREWTASEQLATLDPFYYHWTRTLALAATGDYQAAEKELSTMTNLATNKGQLTSGQIAALLVGQVVLNEQSATRNLTHAAVKAFTRQEFQNRIAFHVQEYQTAANANVMRGVLLLEEGQIDEAEIAFRLALLVAVHGPTEGGIYFNGMDIANRYLDLIRRRS